MKKGRKIRINNVKQFEKVNNSKIIINNEVYSLKPYNKLLNTWKGHKRGLNFLHFTINDITKHLNRKWFYKMYTKGIGFKVFYFKKKYLAFDLGYSSLVLFKP